jgi:dipeptidyl aminopeptidase/acylaminoacyl peptidase
LWNKTTKSFVVAVMKTTLAAIVCELLLILSPFGTCRAQAQSDAAVAQTAKLTVDDLFQFKNLTATLLSPDGKSTLFMILRTDIDQNKRWVNLWIADGNGGTRQLTSGQQIDENPRWSADSQWLAFKSDRERKPEDAGRHQVWLVPANGGEATQLSHDKFDVRTLEWAADGKHIAVISGQDLTSEEQKKYWNGNAPDVVGISEDEYGIYLIRVPDGKAELIYKSERPITSFAYSPKGDEIAFSDQENWREAEGHFHSFVKIVNLATKQVRVLSGGALSSSGGLFSPDGKWIAFQGGPQKNWIANHSVYVVPVGGGQPWLMTGDFDEDVRQYAWAKDSSRIYFTGAKGMDVDLFSATLQGKVSPVYIARGITSSISVQGEQVAFIHESPSEMPNVYLLPLSGAGTGSAKKITDINPKAREFAIGRVETLRWKSKKDGLEVEGQLMTPPDYQKGRPYPLLVVLHGGPNGQSSNNLNFSVEVYPLQVFAAEGYVVFLPNPRGSNGYGSKFRAMAVKDWGGGDYQDVQSGVDELIAKGIADKNRMGIMGWSYGGFLTAWTISHSNRFRAASIGAGPVDLFTMYGATDIPEFMETYFGGSPWSAQRVYFEHSPMTYAKNIKTPTMIQHGGDDGRVPIAVSYELYRALKESGQECVMIRYPNSWHNLGSAKQVREAFTRNLEWFDQHLRDVGPAAVGVKQ